MTDLTASLILLLASSAPAAAAEIHRYRRETGTFTNTPNSTISAPSRTSCARGCSTMETSSFCSGFTFHNGTCHLYAGDEEDSCLSPLVAGPLLEGNTDSGPHSYRLQQNETCPAPPKISKADESASERPGEFSQIDCNHENLHGSNNMMLGIQDNVYSSFMDVDAVKCVSYADIEVGQHHDVIVDLVTNDMQECGTDQVLTALGSSSLYMDDISRVTCSDLQGVSVSAQSLSSVSVSGDCETIDISGDMAGLELPFNVTWPAQCSEASPDANIMVGIKYNPAKNPRWRSLKCCRVYRSLSFV